MRLPEKFRARMEYLLKEEWQELLTAWEKPAYQGLRVNTLKISVKDFQAKAPFIMEPVPWTDDGFYITGTQRPGKHPFYQAGLFYLQEPSAMAPVVCLGIKPGDRVLDLCAAPGGKSTQIATLLQGQGMLVSNDNSAERVKALVWNLEHWGAPNVVVTNEVPEKLAGYFPQFFDKILVDAPCSGEGMFRRDERAVKSWAEYSTTTCSVLQKDILVSAAKMLRPGGKLLYSTCTFAPEENEGMIAWFLERNPEFTIDELPSGYNWQPGRPEWLEDTIERKGDYNKVRRLWPHKVKGEGHFMALLKKDEAGMAATYTKGADREIDEGLLEPLQDFMDDNFIKPLSGPFLLQRHYVYCYAQGLPSLKGLKVPRPGWYLGTIRNNRFEPSQALAMGLKLENVKRTLSLPIDDITVERYLKRETLMLEGDKGWTLVALEEFPLGWGKQTGNFIKNYYPPAWRIMEGR
ncbi:MAG: SAM-dependent methyltransferase [Firmicutes bacterium HGW-Firmicutes-12]|nr:MAG: SAM-dependent methyltransferase [Firmicutes bacterium HGW-Firmicutes-12]